MKYLEAELVAGADTDITARVYESDERHPLGVLVRPTFLGEAVLPAGSTDQAISEALAAEFNRPITVADLRWEG